MVDRSGQLLLTSVLAELITEYPTLPDFDAQEMEKMVYTTHHRQHPLGERILARAHEMQSLLRSYARDIQHHVSIIVDCS